MKYQELQAVLAKEPKTWLVSGAAGFIGSHLVETLLLLDQVVVGLDNFITGNRENLADVERVVGSDLWNRFSFIEGDITKLSDCERAVEGVQLVLHQAALGSVPRSIENPLASHRANVDGFINMLNAARVSGVLRLVYASSSAVYGDSPELPKVEERIGNCLSPYATSKRVDELYADVFFRTYGFESIGLRYFNVFGPRQDPNGAYAAVIPRWISALISGKRCQIYGDGETSRDFCYVENVVQANLLAAFAQKPEALGRVYNIALGDRTTLTELYQLIRTSLEDSERAVCEDKPEFMDFRAGDVRHSHADISAAKNLLDYDPEFAVVEGMKKTVQWFGDMNGNT